MATTHKFSPGEVLKKINEIERLFPVNDWKINGFRIWPFLRTALAYSQNKNPNTRKNKTEQAGKRKILDYVKIAVSAPVEYFNVKRSIKKSKRLFVGSWSHRARINGTLINKYFDMAVVNFREKNEPSTIFDTGRLTDRDKHFNNESLFSLWLLYAFVELRARLSLKKKAYKIELPGYDDFFAHALAHFEHADTVKKHFNKRSVISRATVLYERKEFLKKILQDSNVESAYFLCYYSALLYPMIGACNELGIKTTDIQHGGQGLGHYSYDNWSACPQEGYSLLPRYFWTWDKNSAEIINKWALTTNYHRAIAVGNPWTDVSIDLYNTPPEHKDYILLNMNEIVLEEFVIDAIRHFGDNRKWVLRMHPRTYQNKNVLEDQVRKKGIQDYVVIEDSNKVPLTVSLMHCAQFLSKPSGSLIEAVELGLKPVLLRTHIHYYDHYITDGKVHVLEEDSSAPALIKFLNEADAINASVNIAKKEREDKFIKFEQLSTTP